MLTHFPLQSLAPEMQVSILKQLIYLEDFPKSLLTSMQSNTDIYDCAYDNQIWREAIKYYFPNISLSISNSEYYQAKVYFEKTHKFSSTLLNKKNLNFSDFVYYILNKSTNLDTPSKVVALQAFVIANGHSFLILDAENQQLLNDTFVYACLLQNNALVENILVKYKLSLTQKVLDEMLVTASAQGNDGIIDLLIKHAHTYFKKKAIHNAALKAAKNKYDSILVKFLHQQTFYHKLYFSFKTIAELAISENCQQTMTVLVNDRFRHIRSYIRMACIQAADQGKYKIVKLIYSLKPDIFDSTTKRILFKNAARKNDVNLISMLIDDPAIQNSTPTITQAIDLATIYQNQLIVLMILNVYRSQLRAFPVKQIYLNAARIGLNLVISDMIQNHKQQESQFYSQITYVAATNGHSKIVEMLIKKFSNMLSDSTKKRILYTSGFLRCGISKDEFLGNCNFAEVNEIVKLTEKISTLKITQDNDPQQKSNNAFTPLYFSNGTTQLIADNALNLNPLSKSNPKRLN
ncbi:MAG: hypothetical protein JSS07_12410 [Proteobacteria bacterium]|nr:hypothetical protein [Pseudomonadota bacterium]